MRRRLALGAALAAVACPLAACGGGSTSSGAVAAGTDSAASSTASAPSTASMAPSSAPTSVDGVSLTAQGSALTLGQVARVSWSPDQRTVGVIALRVKAVQKVPVKRFTAWRLDAATRRSTPYYVHAVVANLGHSDLSGAAVPLYLQDQRDVLLQASTFTARFQPCPSRPLPAGFTHGRRTSVCLVYFVPDHGSLQALSFRPTEAFRAITWKKS